MQNTLNPRRRIQTILVALLAAFAITATAQQIGPTDAHAKRKSCTLVPGVTRPDGWNPPRRHFPNGATVERWCDNGRLCTHVTRPNDTHEVTCRGRGGSTSNCYPGTSDGSEGGPSCNL